MIDRNVEVVVENIGKRRIIGFETFLPDARHAVEVGERELSEVRPLCVQFADSFTDRLSDV
jgi:hypothetical protein